MKEELKKYVLIIDFISETFGKKVECVLQEVIKQGSQYTSSIVYIKNSISGRKIGSPGTDFVSHVIKSKIFITEQFIVNYQGKSMDGNLLKSSSMFIKDKNNNLIGILCINIDESKLVKTEYLLDKGLQTLKQYFDDNSSIKNIDVQENMYITPIISIESAIINLFGTNDIDIINMSKSQKKEIVSYLYEKNFFELRDSISKTAKYFSMSEVSIYKYLQEVKEGFDKL